MLSPMPEQEGRALQMGVAVALALISGRLLRLLFAIPLAPVGEGRFRIVPRRPHQPLLLAAAGSAVTLWALWALIGGALDPLSLAALPSGLLSVWIARKGQANPMWGAWLELQGETIRVHCPRAEDWSIPWSAVQVIYLRPRDRSFFIKSPWVERDLFVPTEAALARYWVTDADRLFQALADRLPVEETDVLLRVASAPPGAPAAPTKTA